MLVTLGPLQPRFDRPHRVVDARMQVAEPGKPLRHRRDSDVLGLHVGQLPQVTGTDTGPLGFPRTELSSHRVAGRDRAIAFVAAA
jgi:hypothetical protein